MRKVRELLQVDGGDGCVEATAATIASNEYPISRNLYIYVNNAKAAANPALAGFVDFYTTTGLIDAVSQVGYVQLASAAMAETQAAWAARGADVTANESASGSDIDLSDLEGEIFISGSSTVEPISVRVAELFEEVAPGVFVDVEGPGTGDGFKKFCSGETDISDASRQIKDAEARGMCGCGYRVHRDPGGYRRYWCDDEREQHGGRVCDLW